MHNKHIKHGLGLILGVLGLCFSYQMWTVFLLNAMPGIEDIAFATEETGTAATLKLHASATETKQWGLTRTWSISIPNLGVRAPVYLPGRTFWDSHQWNMLEEQMQVGMTEGVVAYPHSVFPGEEGTLFIAGHSSPPNERAKESDFGRIFEKLPSIDVGDEIIVEEGRESVTYVVEETIIVSSEETSILSQQYDESVLKLITCYPVGTTRERLVVIAKKAGNQ